MARSPQQVARRIDIPTEVTAPVILTSMSYTAGRLLKDSGSLKTFSFGSCHYERTSPPLADLCAETKVINVELSHDEALKLDLALDECIRKINRFKEAPNPANAPQST